MTLSSRDLTPEQRDIIEHDLRAHATVLAVAGAGKTSTMVYRIKHLITEHGVSPKVIRAVMYNRAAREEFQRKLSSIAQQEQCPSLSQVQVQTFHALGYALANWAKNNGLIKSFTILSEDAQLSEFAEEAIRLTLSANRAKPKAALDVDEFLDAVHSWKAMMTPPERARHLREPFYVRVYETFEQERVRGNLLTYDDMIFEAVRLLEEDSHQGQGERISKSFGDEQLWRPYRQNCACMETQILAESALRDAFALAPRPER
jgi:DNA helicase-2/ATP-dependent DNA helicase PcrA